MIAGTANVDYPAAATGLSVLPLGSDEALTSRVRRVDDGYLYISIPRTPIGENAFFVSRDMLDVSWQADDGLRSAPAESVSIATDGTWKVRLTGAASRLQRRDAVRAPIGLPVSVNWGRLTLEGSTVDLSEGGALCVFRGGGELGVNVPFPKKDQHLSLRLNLYSDELVIPVVIVRRKPREDALHEWSLRFVDLPEASADLIRSHVFTALRNARARGLAALY
ncbi:PilZ domain-containing protein [Modestobacter muralis]|uniref:PilZ domain-containing protein n=1 Tax=Modestobacter muralis TaxID=1608614 RepID=A0A6P0H348_9ACTN|nr:PilZ domain-containing protein [Modestobacter muralis]NEK93431.1 PilZ domain-containing protein [Modestobacter muralis]NEN50198.1 PilZ domain-containing protein [Modestobacter muralis]